MTGAPVVVVGIGADGWAGLGEAARGALLGAEEIVGSERQLALLPALRATLRPWPSPIDALLEELVARADGSVCVLASGDPDAARHRRHARSPAARGAAAGVPAPLGVRAGVRAARLARRGGRAA